MKFFSGADTELDIEMAKKGKGDSMTQKKEETKVYQSEDEEILDYLSGRKVEVTPNFDNPWAKKANDLDAPKSETMNRGDIGDELAVEGAKGVNKGDRGDELAVKGAKGGGEGESKVKPKREKRVFGAKKKLAKQSEQEKI